MKSEKGVTLTSLVIYIAIATSIIGTMALVTTFFFSNINEVKKQDKYAVEFNTFNMFFIKDIKNNKTAQVEHAKIILEDGTVYEYNESQKAVYRNETKIANNIEALMFSSDTYVVPNTTTTKNLINVYMEIGKDGNYKKTIEYVLKYW